MTIPQITPEELSRMSDRQKAFATKAGMMTSINNADKPQFTASELKNLSDSEILAAAKEHRIILGKKES